MGPHIVLAHLVTVYPDAIGKLVAENYPSAIHDNLALALEHSIQPLTAALVRFPGDIFASLGKVQCEGRAVLTPPSCGPLPPS